MEENRLCHGCHDDFGPRHNTQVLASRKKTKREKLKIVIAEPLIIRFIAMRERVLGLLGKRTLAHLKEPHMGFDTAGYNKSHAASKTYEFAGFFVADDESEVSASNPSLTLSSTSSMPTGRTLPMGGGK